jgi:Ras-related GTP-binding protein A/B
MELSPNVRKYVLINKMDKLPESQKNKFFTELKAKYESVDVNNNLKTVIFQTSIWDISLYKAWANIISDLIPKVDKIKDILKKFVNACWADEVTLLEKNTLLKIVAVNDKDLKDNERFEKMTDLIKKLKNTCKSESETFKDIFIRTINNIIYIDEFENSLYLIVAFKNSKTSLELVKINMKICKQSFKEIFNDE